jgi:hypothetical protein
MDIERETYIIIDPSYTVDEILNELDIEGVAIATLTDGDIEGIIDAKIAEIEASYLENAEEVKELRFDYAAIARALRHHRDEARKDL